MNVALEPHVLAPMAFDCLFKRQPVIITHPAGWQRPEGWPVPIERNKVPNADGSDTQPYRPIAIFEYCEYVLRQREAEMKKVFGL